LSQQQYISQVFNVLSQVQVPNPVFSSIGVVVALGLTVPEIGYSLFI